MPPEWIDDPAALESALAEMRRADRIAVDTETDSYFAYRPRICLFQVSVPGHDFVIDPMADLDLAPMGEILGDPRHEIILHAAENDVIHMQHEYGWRIGRLFDTQVACFVLGLKPYGLAGILEARFGVKLDKSQQRSDWSVRPLSEKQLFYAAADTSHLHELSAELHEKAAAAGREEEIASECARIAGRTWEPDAFDPDAWRRMSGAKELDGTGQRILSELFLLRHRESDRRNRAPYRVISDSALVGIARDRLTAPRKGIPPAFWNRYGGDVARIVREAPGRGAPRPPPRRKRTGPPVPGSVKRVYEALRRWRGRTAEERGVEPFVVARNELLMEIAQAGCESRADLERVAEPFRVREYGDAMLRAMLDSQSRAPDNGQ